MSEDAIIISREDIQHYCPRKDCEVLIVSNCCFHPSRSAICQGCVFDVELILVKLAWTLVAMLESS